MAIFRFTVVNDSATDKNTHQSPSSKCTFDHAQTDELLATARRWARQSGLTGVAKYPSLKARVPAVAAS